MTSAFRVEARPGPWRLPSPRSTLLSASDEEEQRPGGGISTDIRARRVWNRLREPEAVRDGASIEVALLAVVGGSLGHGPGTVPDTLGFPLAIGACAPTGAVQREKFKNPGPTNFNRGPMGSTGPVKAELVAGFEPATCALRVRCSAC